MVYSGQEKIQESNEVVEQEVNKYEILLFNDDVNTFDFVIDTISAPHDLNAHLDLLKTDGTYILVGASPESIPVDAFSLILRRRRLVGSLIGGMRETQEMLDFCGEHGLTSDVEVIPISQINEAYERVIQGDVRFRFVIDMASLGN